MFTSSELDQGCVYTRDDLRTWYDIGDASLNKAQN